MNTPLQQAAQVVVTRWDKTRYVMQDEMSALRVDLEDEQAQAVEPVAWWNGFRKTDIREGTSPSFSESENTWHDIPLFTHPAPPATPLFGNLIAAHDGLADELLSAKPITGPCGQCKSSADPCYCGNVNTGERAKVGDSRFESWYGKTKIQQMGTKQRYREAYEAGMNEAQQVAPAATGERAELVHALRSRHLKIDTRAEMRKAADMLEADAEAYAQGRYDEKVAQGPSQAEWAAMEAQQVAVPSGWVLVPIEPTDAMCEAAWEGEGVDYVGEHKRIHRADLAYIRMLAAAQGAKP